MKGESAGDALREDYARALNIRICLTRSASAARISKTGYFAAPTGHQDLTPEGYVKPNVVAYYERKAIGGAAAVTVGEGIVDSKRGKGGLYHMTLDDPMAEHGLCSLTDAVTRHGAVASVELQHAGHVSPTGHWPFTAENPAGWPTAPWNTRSTGGTSCP